MALITLTEKDFEATVTKPGMVLVDFWASWCGPCRTFGPIFERAAEKHPEATFAKVDVDANQGLAGALQVFSIPTLMVFRDGIMVFEQPGALPERILEDLYAKVQALDMDEVRKQVDGPAKDGQPATT